MRFSKLIIAFLFICLLLTALFVITACDDTSSEKPTDTETVSEECAHTNIEYVTIKAATCTEKGNYEKLCADCGISLETVEIETISHTEEIIAGKAPTCSEAGITEGKICSVCNTTLVEQGAIAKLNHTERVIEAVAPTCTTTGKTAGKDCSVCQTVLVTQEVIPALNHNESDWIIDKVADVGTEGSKHTECTRCMIEIKRETIPALSAEHIHEGKTWVITTPSTCKEEGTKTLLCDCGKEMATDKLEKAAHTEEKILGTAPTCTSTGLTDGKKCSFCGTVLIAQQTIAKAKHTEEAILGTAPTCSDYGTTDGKRCSVCTEIITAQQPVPPTGHSYASGVCTLCGDVESYGVWIVDGLGYPVSDIIVKILKDGEQIKMYQYDGAALSLDLDTATYTVELDLSQTGIDYVYDEELCKLTPEKPHTTIRLFNAQPDPTTVFVGYPIQEDRTAYEIGQGSYELTLIPNDYTFLIFTPKTAAIYTITYECDSELAISYHGSSFFVQGTDLSGASEDIGAYENGLFANVYASNVGGDLVFAIKSEGATSCILHIANAGDPGTRLEDEPWTPYLEDDNKVKEQLSASKEGTYTVIDLTDTTILAVYNEDDGYYHLNSVSGPVIFIDLTTDSRFVASIQTICANQRMGAYIYDINGDVSEKRSYNELFLQYGMPDNADTKLSEPLRVPLTKKLAEAIQTFGDKNNWWTEGSEANIFDKVLLGAPYNREYAWLLYCGYYS